MKFMREQFDKVRPLFEKGGKLEKLYPLFEAQETFMFVTQHRTKQGAHIRDPMDTKRLMSLVIVGLIPALLFGIYNVGYQYYAAMGATALADNGFVARYLVGLWYVVPIIITSYAVGGIWELLFAIVRKHEINEGFLVTGLLLPMIVPPDIPLWQVAVGISFGVVIGKEVFGGTGMNVFNPALIARAFLFFAYPVEISGEKPWIVRAGPWFAEKGEQMVEGWSGATPLLVAANNATNDTPVPVVEAVRSFGEQSAQVADYSILNCFIGLIPGSIGETSTLMILIGAIILIAAGVASWRIMVSCVVGAVVMAFVCNLIANGMPSGDIRFIALPPLYHLVAGGFAFGVVYMATDPVSGSATNTGKYIYGFLIGVLTVLIRTVNPAYPEGVMLAILFMNAFAPLIDYFVVQKHMARRLKRAQA